MKNPKFFMAGTEGTGLYIVLLLSALGRIGIRALSGGIFRVRVEPASTEAAAILAPAFPSSNWKQPGNAGQDRFSTEVRGGEDALKSTLLPACQALLAVLEGVEVNPDAPSWFKDLAQPPAPVTAEPLVVAAQSERDVLIARVRALKLPGANAASRWSLATLRSKASQ